MDVVTYGVVAEVSQEFFAVGNADYKLVPHHFVGRRGVVGERDVRIVDFPQISEGYFAAEGIL